MPEPDDKPPLAVTVVDVDLPFFSMVKLMVKWTLATIPAAAILIFLAYGAYRVLKGMIYGPTF